MLFFFYFFRHNFLAHKEKESTFDILFSYHLESSVFFTSPFFILIFGYQNFGRFYVRGKVLTSISIKEGIENEGPYLTYQPGSRPLPPPPYVEERRRLRLPRGCRHLFTNSYIMVKVSRKDSLDVNFLSFLICLGHFVTDFCFLPSTTNRPFFHNVGFR